MALQFVGGMMAHLSLAFLGGFDVTLAAQPVTAFGADKARALLAYLAIDSALPHRRAELAAMFYPDLPEKKAAHNLSQSLLRLRKALREKESSGPIGSRGSDGSRRSQQRAPFLVITPQDVQFNICSDCQLDVARFRQLLSQCSHHQHPGSAGCSVCMQWLAQAADLYRGDLLSGLFVPDSYAFEEWRMAQQEELRGQALGALSRLAGYFEQVGEWERVQEYARRQIALEPWREEAHIQIMRALFHSGQTAAALRQFETYRQTLADELGIQPSAEVTAVYNQIYAGQAQPAAVQPGEKEAEAAWLASQGERRQVTVLVCSRGDQGDSEVQGDPDEIHEQLLLCERRCEGIFHRFGGRRALRQGNACLVYFGYPEAYEDAARRAVHSGLAIAAAAVPENLAGLQKPERSVRVGIHTGLLTVGEKRGRRWQDRDLMGAVLELARDCQRLARPGEVLISADTRTLVQEFFDLQMFAAQGLAASEQERKAGSANAGPAPFYQVRGESGVQSRLDWLAHTQRLTLFTGREAEMDQVRACHTKLLLGKGQAVLLRGEPGIGKSRLLWELQHSDAKHPPVLWLVSRCLPYNQNTGLYPLIGVLEQLLGFAAADSLPVRREKLIRMLARYEVNRPSAAWLLSLLLGLPTGEPALETITKAQRDQMSELVVTLLQKRALEQPVVLVIEDLHWSDPSTVDWLGLSISALTAVPCLLLLTARPAFQPAWLVDEAVQRSLLPLALRPLPPEQAEAMVMNLAGEQMLAEDLLQRIVAQADGNPLFIEELTKTMLEQPAPQGAAHPDSVIPITLRDSLVARLDRLGMARETAQWAAVLGRDFSYPVLQACVPYDEQRLQNDLARLIEAELIAPIQAAPQDLTPFMGPRCKSAASKGTVPARYAFKHTLVQEAAYTSLLKRTRQVHHRRVAETLGSRFPQMAETRPEILAQHYANAGMPAQAVDCWLRAGERSREQGAAQEARIFFDRALESIAPDDRERRWLALQGREKVLAMRGERDAQKKDLEALLELAIALDDDARRAYAYLRQTSFAARQGDYMKTLALADEAYAAARRAGDLHLELVAQANKAQTLIFFRKMDAAGQVVERTLAQIDQYKDDSVRAQVLTTAAHYFVEAGDLARAVHLQNQSIEAARRAGIYHSELLNNANLGMVYTLLGLYPQACSTLEAGLERAGLYGDRWIQAGDMRHLGFVYWCMGELDRAKVLAEQALAMLTEADDVYGQATCHGYLGYVLKDSGDLAQAAEHLAKARAQFAEIGLDGDAIEAQAVAAQVALAQGRQVEARQMAIEVANYLRENGLKEFSAPALICMCVADVLEATGSPGISPCELIAACCRDLLQRAEKISDVEWRRSFLENVRENREIMKRYSSMVDC